MTTRDERSFRRLAAATAMLSAPVAYAGEVLGFTAIDFDPTAFSDPGVLVQLGTEGASLFWWSWRLNLLGYYLLVAPVAVFLWYWLRSKRPQLVTLLTLAGLAYVFLGAVGTAINAVVWPELMTEYARAGPDERAVLETVFATYATTVAIGLWGILGRITSAVWWIGVGVLLREERPALGWFTVVPGVFAGVAALGNFFGVTPLVGLGTLGFLLLAPAWAFWLGVDLWRRPVDSVGIETIERKAADRESAR